MASYDCVTVRYKGRLIEAMLRYGVWERGYWQVKIGRPLRWRFHDFVAVDKLVRKKMANTKIYDEDGDLIREKITYAETSATWFPGHKGRPKRL
jgi:hypothetical protein